MPRSSLAHRTQFELELISIGFFLFHSRRNDRRRRRRRRLLFFGLKLFVDSHKCCGRFVAATCYTNSCHTNERDKSNCVGLVFFFLLLLYFCECEILSDPPFRSVFSLNEFMRRAHFDAGSRIEKKKSTTTMTNKTKRNDNNHFELFVFFFSFFNFESIENHALSRRSSMYGIWIDWRRLTFTGGRFAQFLVFAVWNRIRSTEISHVHESELFFASATTRCLLLDASVCASFDVVMRNAKTIRPCQCSHRRRRRRRRRYAQRYTLCSRIVFQNHSRWFSDDMLCYCIRRNCMQNNCISRFRSDNIEHVLIY